MNNNKKSKAFFLGVLTTVIVFLNFYFAIYRIHFFGLFYDFPNDITSLRAAAGSAVLIGGLTYIFLAFLRLRNGNIPFIMMILPLLSVLLYHFVLGNDTVGIVLPFIMMVIQFIMGIIPTILWVIVNRILRLLPFPYLVHTVLSLAAAIILSAGTAFLLNRKFKYKRKKIIKTRRGKHKHSSTHTDITSEPEQPLYQKTLDNASLDSVANIDDNQTKGDDNTSVEQWDNANTSSSIYEKNGYNLNGQAAWNGSMQTGSCSIDFSLTGRFVCDHAYRISGSGWESSDSLPGILQINATAEAVHGEDRYDISGTIHYDTSAFAKVKLQLSDNAQSVTYSIQGEISNFSSTQSGVRHVHLIFENQQNHDVFYAEGSYDAEGLL